jgi:CsoR family transcriptional regulator, copper-sensing transcriptional repressor
VSSSETHTLPGYISDKDALVTRLRRIEGQVRGLQRQVENETYCIDVLTQVSALVVALLLLDDHLGHCMGHATGEDREGKLAEASQAIGRLVRS